MQKVRKVLAVTLVGLSLGLVTVGCGSPSTTGKDKMGGSEKKDDKMKDDKMKDDKMKDDKMKDDKMKDDKMKNEK
jgi:pentapeptide MXKDX repeat protein